MKIKNMKWIALLAIAGIAISAQSAKAANFANGDLILGVVNTGGGQGSSVDYMIDLGAPPPSGSTVALGLNNDLTALYGSGWYTNTNLAWGIVGDVSTGSVLYGSTAETTFGVQSAGFTNHSIYTGTNRVSAVGTLNSLAAAASNGSDVT